MDVHPYVIHAFHLLGFVLLLPFGVPLMVSICLDVRRIACGWKHWRRQHRWHQFVSTFTDFAQLLLIVALVAGRYVAIATCMLAAAALLTTTIPCAQVRFNRPAIKPWRNMLFMVSGILLALLGYVLWHAGF